MCCGYVCVCLLVCVVCVCVFVWLGGGGGGREEDSVGHYNCSVQLYFMSADSLRDEKD